MRVSLPHLASLAFALLASTSPLPESTRTSLSLDSDSLLSSGSVLVHVLRTDDFLSDSTPSPDRSVLERFTHLVLGIQVDEESTALWINGEAIDLSGVRESKGVHAVKAQTFAIPETVDGKTLSTEEIIDLVETTVTAGLVGIDLSIKEDSSLPPTIRKGTEVSTVSYNVLVKITEIDSHALLTTIFFPILRLQLGFAGPSGTPVEMKAFAIPLHGLEWISEGWEGRRPALLEGTRGGQAGASEDRQPTGQQKGEELDVDYIGEVEAYREAGLEGAEEIDIYLDDDERRYLAAADTTFDRPPPPFVRHSRPNPHNEPPAFFHWVADALGFYPRPHRPEEANPHHTSHDRHLSPEDFRSVPTLSKSTATPILPRPPPPNSLSRGPPPFHRPHFLRSTTFSTFLTALKAAGVGIAVFWFVRRRREGERRGLIRLEEGVVKEK